MDLLDSMKISATGLAAHRTKMNVIAENLANVDTTRTADGGPYRRKMVVFKDQALENFKSVLEKNQQTNQVAQVEFSPIEVGKNDPQSRGTGVAVDEIVQSQEDFRLVYNPAHPDADPVTGYVAMPNVDHLTEVADMIVAKRSYEASITAISNTKSMILKALELGK
ncbi:FlgC [Desulforapulum autotrophicum HRM2]|uniref:Flagellar basal-body rod protein FlgC n=1 Tax=Desulforapulum autotrophicum (strain ATCC 43914 / DSM 3382 / VKM B-1955 / HRM2) TaxID=177437 RepID=C0QAK6_DESAH|nr:flagellar basal body rod protein FlgC [Desulforapulum autotrophicum]ACN16789.1 FlgC [Desulforapulum autotrophicum HRM2]